MRNDINLLRQEVIDIANERDHLKKSLSNVEREKEQIHIGR
jgi:GTP1/Obg family GTP-binding protein